MRVLPYSISDYKQKEGKSMDISQQRLDEYRRNGIVKVEQLISREEAARYRTATPTGGAAHYSKVFHQYVDTWRTRSSSPIWRRPTASSPT